MDGWRRAPRFSRFPGSTACAVIVDHLSVIDKLVAVSRRRVTAVEDCVRLQDDRSASYNNADGARYRTSVSAAHTGDLWNSIPCQRRQINPRSTLSYLNPILNRGFTRWTWECIKIAVISAVSTYCIEITEKRCEIGKYYFIIGCQKVSRKLFVAGVNGVCRNFIMKWLIPLYFIGYPQSSASYVSQWRPLLISHLRRNKY